MKKHELFTIKQSLHQYYGRTVTKKTKFDEYTEDKTVHQTLKDLVFTTEVNRESEYQGIKTNEKSISTSTLPEGTILIWEEGKGYIVPEPGTFYKLEDLQREIREIKKIYKDVRKWENDTSRE